MVDLIFVINILIAGKLHLEMEKGKLNSNKYEEILVYEILLFKLDMVILKDSIKVQYQTNSISKN